jgi:RNase P subunit RPR2
VNGSHLTLVPAENRVICKNCQRPLGMHLGFQIDGTMYPGQDNAIVMVCVEKLPTFEAADTIEVEPTVLG